MIDYRFMSVPEDINSFDSTRPNLRYIIKLIFINEPVIFCLDPFACNIMYQKQVDGELWTVVECGYCGAMVRLEKESAQELADCVIKNYSGDYGKKVSERIMQGYK